MAQIKIDLGAKLVDGMDIKFKAPCDCTAVTGLLISYISDTGEAATKGFTFRDLTEDITPICEVWKKEGIELKEIAKIEVEESLSENNIILAKLMARKYFCNISDCIKLMLPPGTGAKVLENRTKEKTGNFVYLKKTKEEIEFYTAIYNYLLKNICYLLKSYYYYLVL